MKVLVTGASGMLGRAVATALRDRGDDVRTLQRRASGIAGVEDVAGSITTADDVARSVRGVDAVVHLAAKVSMTGHEAQFSEVNIGGTALLASAMCRAGVTRWVHVSSPSVAHAGSSLVGSGAGRADPATARGAYARSKARAEQVALAADLATTAIRPHLVWGPGDTQLVGRIVDRARAGRLATVGTGGALIDTTYVTNAADAIVAALDALPRVAGRAFVISNGEPRTVSELVQRICLAAGVAPPRHRVPVKLATVGGAIVERMWPRVFPMLASRGFDEEPPMSAFLAEQLSTAHWFDQRETRDALRWTPAVSLDEGFGRLTAAYARR